MARRQRKATPARTTTRPLQRAASESNGPSAYDREVMGMMGGPWRGKAREEQSEEVREMRLNRRVNSKQANASSGQGRGGASISFATGRPQDPFFYWKQNNLPWEVDQPDQLARIRQYCRLLYMAHPYIPSLIDIYTKYPLTGMELSSKDNELTDFYQDLFFTEEGLNYEDFLTDFGREYWTVGEALPFGSFNESLGVWEDDELLDPDDVEIERSPFLREPRFYIKLPQVLREIIQSRSPAWEYEKLMTAYPELANYMGENQLMPVSNILLRQYKFKGSTFSKRGIPLLMRAMRTVIQEEKLNAALDAIADRLYTPLLLARLGASATDLGTSIPWIPTQDDLADFEEAIDGALAADFRMITYHFGAQIESVFGRENMPDLNPDFDRIMSRILQSFGLSQTMLSGASSGETYAADALNRDLVTQLLSNFQKLVARHFRQRALVVAEAQEHFDYEVRNGKRYVIMEEILEVDEETGEERIVEQPKLLVPDLKFKTMNIRDEESEREFLEALRAAGVPVSIKTRLQNVPIDFADEIEQSRDEAVEMAVAEQQTRLAIFKALRSEGLPIPQDLRDDFEPKAIPQGTPGDIASRIPMMGLDPVTMQPTLAPTMQDMMLPPAGGVPMPGMPATPVDGGTGMPMNGQSGTAPMNGSALMGDQTQRPPESDEQRANMPKPGKLFRRAQRMRAIAMEHYEPPERDEKGKLVDSHTPSGGFEGPKHIGMRRYLNVSKDTPLDEDSPV